MTDGQGAIRSCDGRKPTDDNTAGFPQTATDQAVATDPNNARTPEHDAKRAQNDAIGAHGESGPLVLTAADLRAAGALAKCDQVALFEATFPDGAPLTADAMAQAVAAGLTVEWAEWLLDADARAEYRRAIDTARAECRRAIDTARAEYRRAIATALLAGLVATWQRRAEHAEVRA